MNGSHHLAGGGASLGERGAGGRLLPLVADLHLAQPLPQLVALLLALLLSEDTAHVHMRSNQSNISMLQWSKYYRGTRQGHKMTHMSWGLL